MIVLDRGIFLRERIPRSKTITDKFTQWLKNGAKLLLSLIIAILDILMYFRCNLWQNTLTYFCTHCLSISVREFRSVQAWRSSRKLINACVRGAVRTLGSRFKRKHTWRSWHHDLESIRHDLESLCSDNDPRCHIRKINNLLGLDQAITQVINYS